MTHQMLSRAALALALTASTVMPACGAQSEPEVASRPPRGSLFVMKNEDKEDEIGTGRIGMVGYGRFLQPGYSGNGSALSAGLPTGGGPVPLNESDEGPRALAPNEHFGSPHHVRPVYVATDTPGHYALYVTKVNHKE